MRIAFYDLDETLAARATFTPFLLFAARRLAPWRLVLAPVWVLAMACYKAGLYNRTALKTLGMTMMLGRHARGDLADVGRDFAARHIARSGWHPGVMRLLDEDRAAGARIVMATAALDFYARAFADMLGVDDLIASRWTGRSIEGGNCYGRVKYVRVQEWLAEQGIDPAAIQTRMVSDSMADAPLLAWADDAVFVTSSARKAGNAPARGWQVIA